MSDIAMMIAKRAKDSLTVDSGPSQSELRHKAKVACAFRLMQALDEEDADLAASALEDFIRINEVDSEDE